MSFIINGTEVCIYHFYWGHSKQESFDMAIDIEDRDKVVELLDEYRNKEENYNADGFKKFLKDKDYKAFFIGPDYCIYF